MTKEQLISDLELRLTAGKPSDDVEIPRPLLATWLDQARATVIQAESKQTGEISPSAYTRLECQSVALETPECVYGDCFVNVYLTIPTPLSLAHDRGVQVSFTNGRTVHKIPSPQSYSIFKNLRFGKPEIGYYRVGDRLYIFGQKINHNHKFTVHLVLANTQTIDDTDTYPIPEHLIPMILQSAEEIGLRMLQVQQDINNDGKS